jgi:plastocyanin
MLRRTLLAALPGGAGILAATTAGVRAADEALVTIDNFTFAPARIAVPVGTRVTWTNRDDIPHTVVGSDAPRRLRSPPLDTGESYAFAFAEAGTFRYFCSLHPHMQGTVVVQ